jgi:hypothetical protein
VALGLLQRSDGRYSNTPETDLFLDRNKPSYLGGFFEMANHRLFGFWNHLSEALRTGQLQNEAKEGENPFPAIYAAPARLRQFLRSMTGISRGANLAIAAKFPWREYKTIVDVGTAQGDLPAQVAMANDHLSAIGFDLPAVEPVFTAYARETGLSERMRFAPGDFFADELPRADVVTMGHILHDWDLETKRMLLRKAYEALPGGGAVVVYDAIIDDDRSQNAFGLLMSLNMLIETPGGFDYTARDCREWMAEVGFRESRVEHLVGPDSMVVGIK